MKNLKLLLTSLVLALASPTLLQAEDNSGVKVPSDVVILRPKKPIGRPNAPSLIGIECVYYDGLLTLSSDHYTGVFSLSFENYETGAVYTVPSIQIGESVSVALEIGEYEVITVGEDGTELIGFMQVY